MQRLAACVGDASEICTGAHISKERVVVMRLVLLLLGMVCGMKIGMAS